MFQQFPILIAINILFKMDIWLPIALTHYTLCPNKLCSYSLEQLSPFKLASFLSHIHSPSLLPYGDPTLATFTHTQRVKLSFKLEKVPFPLRTYVRMKEASNNMEETTTTTTTTVLLFLCVEE